MGAGVVWVLGVEWVLVLHGCWGWVGVRFGWRWGWVGAGTGWVPSLGECWRWVGAGVGCVLGLEGCCGLVWAGVGWVLGLGGCRGWVGAGIGLEVESYFAHMDGGLLMCWVAWVPSGRSVSGCLFFFWNDLI